MPKFLSDGHFVGSATDLTLDGQLFLSSTTSDPGASVPISFDSGAGGIWYDSDDDHLWLRAAGSKRAYVSSAGIISQHNVYTGTSSQFRNYGGVWAGTTGQAGNGFYFLNTANSNTTKAMELTSTGSIMTVNGEVRATKYVDKANTSYFINPKSDGATDDAAMLLGRVRIGSNEAGAISQFGVGGRTQIQTMNYKTGAYGADGQNNGITVLANDATVSSSLMGTTALVLHNTGAISTKSLFRITRTGGRTSTPFSSGLGAYTCWFDIKGNGDVDIKGNIRTTRDIGRDDHNRIMFSTDDSIIYRIADSHRFRMDSDNLSPYVDSSYDLGTNSVRWRNVYADTLYGDGSNLTNLPSGNTTTINNNADNRIITGSGTADTLEAESGFTFDGNDLTIAASGTTTKRLYLSSDTDYGRAHIGRAYVGKLGFDDHGGFSHMDHNTQTNYAILQNSSGKTFLNSASGQETNFRINNSTIGKYNSSGIHFPIYYDSNDTAFYVNPASGSNINSLTVGEVVTTNHIYGRYVNNSYSLLYRFGGLFFTWDSDSYGTNTEHSIRSTYGNTFTDSITLNSFNHIRFNIDSNNNNSTSYFEVGDGTTGTGNIIMRLDQSGNLSQLASVTSSTFTATSKVTTPQIHNSAAISILDGSAAQGLSVRHIFAAGTYGTTPGSGDVWATSDMRAPIFYDYDNTNYYVDPNSQSVVDKLQVKGRILNGLTSSSTDNPKTEIAGFIAVPGPETTNNFVLPGITENKLAGAHVRSGYTVSVTKDGSTLNNNLANAFLANDSYASISSTTASTVVVITISHPNFNHGSNFGITFSNPAWRAKDVKIERSTDSGSNYTTIYNVTDSARSAHIQYSSTGSTATNQIRITLTNFNTTSSRITHIIGNNYAGGEGYFAQLYKDNVLYGDLDVGGLRIVGDNDSTDQGKAWIRSNGDYIVINPVDGEHLYLNWDTGDSGGSGHVKAAGAMYATQFIDRNDSSYYLDAASTGTSLNVAGAIQLPDAKAIMWAGNNIISHNGTQTYIGDNVSSSSVTITGGNVTIGGTSVNDTRSLTLQTNSEQNTVINLKEANANYGFSLVYDGSANDFIIKRHDNSAGGINVLTLNRTDNNATFAGDLTVSGGDITLGGTGRIQGVDTVSAGTDAANKTYVDNAVSGFASADTTYEFNFSTQLSANTWTDTGIDGTDMETGTYIMRVEVDDHNIGGGHYSEAYSATINWFAGGTNSTMHDEIPVHRSGHAPNNSDLQFRTLRHSNGGDDLVLQVKINTAYSAAPNQTDDGKKFKFKFRKMI